MKRSIICWLLTAVTLATIPGGGTALDAKHVVLSQVEARALRYGDQGHGVQFLQQQLIAAGFDPGKVDGIFGPRTEAAVRAAQTELGLTVDGLAGRETMAALMARIEGADDGAPDGSMSGQSPASGDEEHSTSAEFASLVFYRASTSPASAEAVQEEVIQVDRSDSGPHLKTSPQMQTGAGLSGHRRAANVSGSQLEESAAVRPLPLHPELFSLTFNGVPSPRLLPELLATLRRHGMKATFFVHGEVAESRPELLKAIVREGHEIASNGWTHQDMTGLTAASVRKELHRTQRALQQAVGDVSVFFRPPGGRFDRQLIQNVEALGLQMVLWANVTLTDHPETDPSQLAAGLSDLLYPGAVLMLHQDRPNSVRAVDHLLKAASARGFQSVSLSQLMARHP